MNTVTSVGNQSSSSFHCNFFRILAFQGGLTIGICIVTRTDKKFYVENLLLSHKFERKSKYFVIKIKEH